MIVDLPSTSTAAIRRCTSARSTARCAKSGARGSSCCPHSSVTAMPPRERRYSVVPTPYSGSAYGEAPSRSRRRRTPRA